MISNHVRVAHLCSGQPDAGARDEGHYPTTNGWTMIDHTGAPGDADALVAGTRLRCDECGAEVIVLNTASADLRCCGEPLTVTFDGESRASGSSGAQA